MGTADHAAPNQTAALGTDHDPVFHLGDAGRRQATRSASSRSIQERTVPFSITSLPFASTVIRLASTSAFRMNASWILRLSSEGSTLGFTVMALVAPFTPFT